MSFSGNGLLLEFGAAVTGVLLGFAALSFMKFEYDAGAHRAYSLVERSTYWRGW
jgi:hypothetical protein